MKYIFELKTGIDKDPTDDKVIEKLLLSKLKIQKNELLSFKLTRKSLDARKKPELYFQLQLEIELKDKIAGILLRKGTIRKVETKPEKKLNFGTKKMEKRPVVIGDGPAGLMCAYVLAEQGLRPIVVERGSTVEERVKAVNQYVRTGIFNEKTNIAFGEGGAGTFSDGKLTTRSKSPLVRNVLDILIEGGADKSITYLHNPHLGTDGLRNIVTNLRNKMIEKGTDFLFERTFTGLETEAGRIKAVNLDDGSVIETDHLILAIGHSAKDTVRFLHKNGIPMEAKPFSMGARIEHKASLINKNQYGRDDQETIKILGNSEYHLTYKGERGVYSFCMCPGGIVVPSNSHTKEIVTNGMSYKNRAGKQSNAAIVANVGPLDFKEGPLGGLLFQEEIEHLAFRLAGNSYLATGQNARDFVDGTASTEIKVDFKPSYLPGIRLGNLWDILPEGVAGAIREGLMEFDRKIPGFIDQGFLTGPETRTSSPVRILRDENAMVLGYNGVYAIGEGAGYAGGIVSAGIDGLKTAYGILNEVNGVSD